MPPIRARMDSSPARSVDTANSSKTGASSSDPQQQERSKHIEVCVRLRPLVIQKEASSSSFFHGTTPSTTKRRKPGLPRPNASSRIPGSVRKAVEKLETRQDSQLEAATTTYAWDVVDDDTVTQSPTTEIILGRTHTYTLDSVYGPDCQTAEVYQKSVHDLVHAAMNGYHASVLAYGQTSTGKTHTMTGTVQEPGFIPLAIKQCFQCLSQLQHTNREFLFRVSYLEVYKEHIRDLLASGPAPPPVRLFEKNGQLQIKGLREEVVTTPEQVFAILAEGEARRQVGATHLNQHSSRSHVMVRLWIESRERATTNNNNGNDGSNHAPQRESVRASTLSLVDLAGSESVRLTGSTERRAEGHYINQSLMTLGKVVYALSESTATTDDPKKQPQHVPYRDSKLTRLLQPSLSGNAQVVLLCCISPLPSHIEESHNTFKFAIRAKKIPQKAVIQNVGDADEKTLLQSYRDEIEDLRKQLQEADAQRRELLEQQAALSSETAVTLRSPTTGATAEDAEEEMRELMDAIQTMEKLILKTGEPQQPPSPATTTEQTNGVGQQGGGDDGSTAAAPLTPDRQYATENGSGNATTPSTPKDDLRVELARIQGLLGSVLKKRSLGAAAAAAAAPALASSSSEEELRQLRAQLEEQEVATSLRQADSSFLLAQLEEKDNLLAEVSKILEAVEERQAALEAENKALRKQLDTMRIAARSRSVGL